MSAPSDSALAADVAAVGRIPAVHTILEVVCRSTGLGFAAVARVTPSRWIACAVRDEIAFGLQAGGELDVSTTLCDQIRATGELVVIDHVDEDPTYCRHLTPAKYGFQSYISVPITLPNGSFFGTLCAIGPRPAKLNTPETLGMFTLFASLIAFHLDAQDRVSDSERALIDERRSAELREQFIAVMGHDLRSPLAAISASAMVLSKSPLDTRSAEVVAIILRSAARMRDLIENVMDFARGRLGGGLSLSRKAHEALEAELHHIVDEFRTTSPDRVIQSDISLDRTVFCDGARIAQLLSNLLANALAHGDPNSPVRISARTNDSRFELFVSNSGEPIPPSWMNRLFQPFSRASVRPGQAGLGLGLYIASQIAREHGGTLEATSTREETRFTFTMPNPR
jgi:signal transduction histidine kinase